MSDLTAKNLRAAKDPFLRLNGSIRRQKSNNHAGFGHFVFFSKRRLFFIDKDTMLR
jgi:hypothetical protein